MTAEYKSAIEIAVGVATAFVCVYLVYVFGEREFDEEI